MYEALTEILKVNNMSDYGIATGSIYALPDEPNMYGARVSEGNDPFDCTDIYFNVKTLEIEDV
jgi:hypothetical protein